MQSPVQIKSKAKVADLVKKLLGESPFLDLGYTFNVDLASVQKHVCEIAVKIERETPFEVFANQRETKQPEFLSLIAAMEADSDSWKAWHVVDVSTEYVICLNGDEFPTQQLVEHYERVLCYCRAVIQLKDNSALDLATTLVQPVLRWSLPMISADEATRVLRVIDGCYELVASAIKHNGICNHLIELLNVLAFTSFIAARSMHTGIPSSLFCNHLLVFRKASSSAWATILEPIRLRHATMSLHMFKAFYSIDELFEPKYGFSMNTLADMRSLMADAVPASDNAGALSHQWVFRWMRDKFDADVFSTRRLSTNLVALTDGEQQMVVELARRFGTYRFPITVEHLQRFLVQFGSTQRIRAAIRLLTHTKFYPLWELADAIQIQLKEDFSEGKRIVIAPSGDRTGSAAIINYLASHSSMTSKMVFAEDIHDALDKTQGHDTIYFVDDCLLSGTQTLSVLQDLFGLREVKPHHTRYSEPLAPPQQKELRERTLTFVYCVACDVGIERVRSGVPLMDLNPDRFTIKSATIESLTSKAFEPMGPVSWASAEERDDLKEFAAKVGYNLLGERTKRKNWSESRRRESSLGYSNFQRLLVFPYNVPKTTLPIFWEHGSEEQSWVPLFAGSD